ncbi:MAG: ATP-binding cassette domain-containing protein [Planctomycetota bacterium]
MPAVLADQLAKHYRVADKKPGLLGTAAHFFNRRTKTVEAVKGVSFAVEPGEIVGFLGPNGAGKTTTLKMLTGLMEPTAGRCEVLGQRPFDRDPSLLQQITLVMGQKQQLMWDLPAADSLRINAAVYDIAPRDAERRAADLAEMLGVTDELTRPVRKLSLGQRMKVELIAALLHRPKVLFLDEPTLGLDINAQTAVRDFLRAYNAEQGAAMLLTSHYMADITALCERVILIHEGRVIHDGGLDLLLERFAPFREVALDFDTSQPAPASDALARFGDVESHDGHAAKLLVSRDRLASAVAAIMADLPVADLTIHDPPIEQVINRAFDTSTQDNEQEQGEAS